MTRSGAPPVLSTDDEARAHLAEMVRTKIARGWDKPLVTVGFRSETVMRRASEIADAVMRDIDLFGFAKAQLPLVWAGCHAHLQELARQVIEEASAAGTATSVDDI